MKLKMINFSDVHRSTSKTFKRNLLDRNSSKKECLIFKQSDRTFLPQSSKSSILSLIFYDQRCCH